MCRDSSSTMTCEITIRSHPRKDHEEVDTGDAEISIPRTKRKVENASAVRRKKQKIRRPQTNKPLQHLIVGHSELTSDTSPLKSTHRTPTRCRRRNSQSLKIPTRLKSSCGLPSCGVGARWFSGQSPASFGVGRPLRGRRGAAFDSHHGPSIPTTLLVRPPVPCASRYLGLCPPGARRWVSWLRSAFTAP